jgi:hypothetical protein
MEGRFPNSDQYKPNMQIFFNHALNPEANDYLFTLARETKVLNVSL